MYAKDSLKYLADCANEMEKYAMPGSGVAKAGGRAEDAPYAAVRAGGTGGTSSFMGNSMLSGVMTQPSYTADTKHRGGM